MIIGIECVVDDLGRVVIPKKYRDLYDIKENSMKEDYLKYQLNELEKANLDLDEESNLQKEMKVLSNSEKVKLLITNIKEIYNESDLLDKIYESISTLDKLSNYDESFKNRYAPIVSY